MKIEKYKDKQGKHRWRVKAKNGRIILASSQGYTRAENRDKNFEIVKQAIREAR